MGVRLPPRAPFFNLASMNRNFVRPMVSVLLIVGAQSLFDPPVRMAKTEARALTGTYLGFDLNTYPGDDALPILRKTFSLAATGLAPRPEPSKTPGLASATSSSHRNLGFSFSIAVRKAAS